LSLKKIIDDVIIRRYLSLGLVVLLLLRVILIFTFSSERSRFVACDAFSWNGMEMDFGELGNWTSEDFASDPFLSGKDLFNDFGIKVDV
jgi:hypothetical protein